MITITQRDDNRAVTTEWNIGDAIPDGLFWIDMISPTHDEHLAIEKLLSIAIPSKTEVWKNNVLNRLYTEDGVVI